MDVFEIARDANRRLKLFVLFWRRIVFVRNHFRVPFMDKVKANVFGGFLADQWALYELDMKRKNDYLSEFDWYRSRYINDPFDEMLNNKIIATEVLRQYIRVPEMLLINSKGRSADFGGRAVSTREALALVRDRKDVVIKPFRKGKGVGVHRLSYDGLVYRIDGCETGEEETAALLEENRDWYLTETVCQHPYAEALYDRTVNTIRIITLRAPETGQMKVFFAVQRIGTSRTIPVDNASRGGLVCCIDLDTGRLSYGRSLRDKTVYETHPDSGTRFENVVIPNWERLKQEILVLSERFPYLHFVAWDVVILPDGNACVIEANTSSGVNIIQLWGGQRNGELGDFYRSHGIIGKRRHGK